MTISSWSVIQRVYSDTGCTTYVGDSSRYIITQVGASKRIPCDVFCVPVKIETYDNETEITTTTYSHLLIQTDGGGGSGHGNWGYQILDSFDTETEMMAAPCPTFDADSFGQIDGSGEASADCCQYTLSVTGECSGGSNTVSDYSIAVTGNTCCNRSGTCVAGSGDCNGNCIMMMMRTRTVQPAPQPAAPAKGCSKCSRAAKRTE